MFNCIQYRFGCKLSLLSIFPLGENPHLKRSWFWYSRLRVWMPEVHLPSAKSYRCPCKNWAGQKIGTHTLTLMIDSYWWLKENLKNGEKKRSSSSPFFSLHCFHPNHLLRAWLLSQSLATALLPFPSGNPCPCMHPANTRPSRRMMWREGEMISPPLAKQWRHPTFMVLARAGALLVPSLGGMYQEDTEPEFSITQVQFLQSPPSRS